MYKLSPSLFGKPATSVVRLMVYLGHYSTAIEAAEAYDAYCSIHCTDKQLNFNKDK